MFHLEAHAKWKEDSMSEGIWCVLVFNDDAIPMAFVVYPLRHVFQKDADEARRYRDLRGLFQSLRCRFKSRRSEQPGSGARAFFDVAILLRGQSRLCFRARKWPFSIG
jgi:hypothetical protein